MIYEIKDTLTLDDDNEYVVVSKVEYENKTYFYLVDKNKKTNIKFCYQDKDDLVEFFDKKLTTKLIPLFLNAAKNEIN